MTVTSDKFDKKFCSPTSIPKYSVWNAEALAYPKEVKKFIEDNYVSKAELEREKTIAFLEGKKMMYKMAVDSLTKHIGAK